MPGIHVVFAGVHGQDNHWHRQHWHWWLWSRPTHGDRGVEAVRRESYHAFCVQYRWHAHGGNAEASVPRDNVVSSGKCVRVEAVFHSIHFVRWKKTKIYDTSIIDGRLSSVQNWKESMGLWDSMWIMSDSRYKMCLVDFDALKIAHWLKRKSKNSAPRKTHWKFHVDYKEKENYCPKLTTHLATAVAHVRMRNCRHRKRLQHKKRWQMRHLQRLGCWIRWKMKAVTQTQHKPVVAVRRADLRCNTDFHM